jgi:hypothetical protein
MISQQFQQREPPNKVNTFMEKAGWQIITIVCTMIATIAGLVWIGNIHILDFTWLLLILSLIMVGITISSVWYTRKTRKILQNKYQEDIAALRNDNRAFKDEFRQLVEQEIRRSHEFEINFSQAITKEQQERLEKVKCECLEVSGEVKTELTSWIQNNQTLLTQWTNSHANAHKWELQSYQEQLKTLEEKLTDKLLSEKGY